MQTAVTAHLESKQLFMFALHDKTVVFSEFILNVAVG